LHRRREARRNFVEDRGPSPGDTGPMDTIASRWQLIFLESAILAVFTIGAYLMVALLAA